jgi:alanine racemase
MNFLWITPVITDLETLVVLWKLGKKITVHIKIDTWMHRQGITLSEIPEFLRILGLYPKLTLEWVCTHLADADNASDDTFSFFQTEHFIEALKLIESSGFHPRYRHIDNSAGHLKSIWKGVINASRIWLSLYGINPFVSGNKSHSLWEKLENVLEFSSTIVSKKSLLAGERVSYGLTFKAPWDMQVGIIPVWYYEWLPRSLSNEDYNVSIGWNYFPILGKICMNMCIVDITNKKISVGDKVIVYSRQKNAENSISIAAKKANMISYEVLVKLAESIRRKIIDE